VILVCRINTTNIEHVMMSRIKVILTQVTKADDGYIRKRCICFEYTNHICD
jgi:hypothetical protein